MYNLKLIENLIHFIILTELIFGLGIWIYYAIKNKPKREYSIAPILFFIHSLIFFILSSFNIIDKNIYILWRDLVFLHAITIFFTTGILETKSTGGK